MNEEELLAYCSHLVSVKSYPKAWKAFIEHMQAYQYGQDEICNAWLWFVSGYLDGRSAFVHDASMPT